MQKALDTIRHFLPVNSAQDVKYKNEETNKFISLVLSLFRKIMCRFIIGKKHFIGLYMANNVGPVSF